MTNDITRKRTEEISDLLSSYQGIGEVVDEFTGLTGLYSKLNYTNSTHRNSLPDFVEAAMGPPLQMLPSYKPATAEATPIENGIGRAFDETHMEMRNLGKRIAKFLLGPKFAEMTRDGGLRGSISQVQGGIKIPLMGKDGLPTGDLLEVPGRLAEQIVMLGAISKQFMGRKNGERDLLDDEIGNAMEVYQRMGSLQGSLISTLEAQGLDEKVDLKPLLLNAPKIKQAFLEEAPHFRDIRVLAQIAHYGILTDTMCTMCDLEYGCKDVKIENPKDAACAFFALGRFAESRVSKEMKEMCKDQSEVLARAANDKEAVRLLASPPFQHTLEVLSEKQNMHPSYAKVMQSAIKGLESYQAEHLSRPLTHEQIAHQSGLEAGVIKT